jgi:thiol-disulfide isomerase/thioredoxin/sugar lactone lactonase YvrE
MKRNIMMLGAALGVLLLALLAGRSLPPGNALAMDDTTPTAVPRYEGKVTAPEFTTGLEWINVEQPLTMVALRGKIVLLDFWTYGCINCMHIIPELKQLEEEFPDELIVIGVHSAKFKNEGSTANIREIVKRYEVTHPVVNDFDFDIWNNYNVDAWPTLFLIDPAGKIVGKYAGEGIYSVFAPIIEAMVRQWDERKAINRDPIKITPELANRKPAALSFPGKVLADAKGGRLFISDSNHHRIVIADLKTYEVQAIIGNGQPGLKDGTFTTAGFNRPQGLALAGDTLYVADTENHAIRAIDLKGGKVTTLAGTGQQALKRNNGGAGLKTELNSPWDVAVVGDQLLIAMAGTHQIWALNLANNTVAPYAGSGREGLVDAALKDAQMAQPSGIISDGKLVYFTDPEASAIRTLEPRPDGQVKTIIGKGLFDFGDADGTKDKALLQHALGVTLAPDGKLYIADTYNHKIKQVDVANSSIKTLFGLGKTGLQDGGADVALFNEPGGLSYADGKLYIADTNNGVIRVIDLGSNQVSTIKFPNEDVLIVQPLQADVGEKVALAAQTVAPGETQIVINITVPPAYKLNDIAPFSFEVAADPLISIPKDKNPVEIVKPKMPLTIPVTLKEGQTTLQANADVYYCDAVNERLCYVSRLKLTIPITVKAEGGKGIKVDYVITPPKV